MKKNIVIFGINHKKEIRPVYILCNNMNNIPSCNCIYKQALKNDSKKEALSITYLTSAAPAS